MKTKRARILKARELIENIDNKLLNGFNPFESESLGFTKVVDVLDKILEIKATYTKPRTVQTYRSYINNFKKWIYLNNYESLIVEAFNYQKAREFADYLMTVRKVNNRTYNNYLEHLRTIFNELVTREYIIRNPFKKIPFLPESERNVFAYSKDELQMLKDHFPKNAPEIWLVCQFVFYCAIRPAELVRLKVKHIDLENDRILIPAEISKTKRQDVINIPSAFMNDLRRVKLNKLNPDYYLFSKNLLPGTVQIAPTRLAEKFKIEAKKIGLKRKLYELKHTGAGMAIEAGVNIRDLQMHLRHSNVNTTEIYLKAFRSSTSEDFIKNFPSL